MELENLVMKLDEQNDSKNDYLLPSNILRMQDGNLVVADTKLALPIKQFTPNNTLHNNICTRLSIPNNYYRYLQQNHVDMLDYNVSELFMRQQTKQVLLRTFDTDNEFGVGRALLSDHYKTIDNFDVLCTTLEAVTEARLNVQVESCDITETKMYIRFTVPDAIANLHRDGNVNDSIMAGFILSNSEVGLGTFLIHPRLTVLSCTNGMIVEKGKIAQRHLGSQMEFMGKIEWSKTTRQREMLLLQSQIKDAVLAFSSPEYVRELSESISNKGNIELLNPVETVTRVGQQLSFSEERRESLFNHFISGKDNTRFGLMQAVTSLAHNDEGIDPDERFRLESAALPLLDTITAYDVEGSKN
jgi:hypothetical protein